MFAKNVILGVGFTDAQNDTVLEYIVNSVEKKEKKYFIVTPNPEILVIANKNIGYKKILNDAKLALPDGVGVILAARFLKKDVGARFTGVDLVKKVCERVAGKPITVGFLGAGPGVAEKAAECLISRYPGLKIAFAVEELENLSSANCDILFVAFGSPKQEEWIAKNLDKLSVTVAIGVGGAFDFISGTVRRAPKIVQGLGFEWLFRLILQPWRIKRQLRLVKFVWLVLKEKLNLK